MFYYGVYIPAKPSGVPVTSNGANTTNSSNLVDTANDVNKCNNETDVSNFVYQNKFEALKVLKQHKDARFKEFLSEEDAIKFSKTGFEIVQTKNSDKTLTESIENTAFKAPTKQQLVRFRTGIEYDEWTFVKEKIWDNPRYLVSSGDTPTILKEGYRYNAMHVCAIHRSPNVAKLILDTVSDPKFADLLMGKKSSEISCKELCANLLDYYLNMPEKGRNETPLHLASKFGHPEIVAILTSYSECKILRNIHGLLPQNIICDRKNKHLSAEVSKSLEERYYVPVLRCNDCTVPAQIGEPFSACNPPNLNCDPLTPEVEVKALAGPMSQEKAKKFFRRWKTPPRLEGNVSTFNANNTFISPMKPVNSTPTNSSISSLKRRSLFNSTPQRHDYNGFINSNGFDKFIFDDSFDKKQNGNHESEANKCGYSDREETNNNTHSSNSSILLFKQKSNAFSNYRDPIIASSITRFMDQKNSDSLLNVSDFYDTCFTERHIKNTDVEKGLECIGRVLAKENDIEWREYWDFLESFVDIASENGLKKLENYLAQRQSKENEHNNLSDSAQKPDIIDDVCNALENAFRTTVTSTATTTVNTSVTHQSSTPYTYVEKSLQVHARRMTKTIIHNIDNEVSIIDALVLELRRVKSLIYSFKEDASYTNVNFKKVHSRISNLVSMFLENSQEVSKQMKWKILVVLQNITVEQGEKSEHMECVCSRIFQRLQHPTEQVLPEHVKTEEMCSKIWSQEKDCDCQWESNLSRRTSYRSRMEARYKNHQRLKQQEKFQKELENQQKAINTKEEEAPTEQDGATDSLDEDEFWSDFGDSHSDEDEVFLTPRESPSSLSLSDADNNSNNIFIYGNEPTKRDLDVLNAIFHVTIDETKYPNIHSWKSTIMRYSSDEMEFFPSPRTVKKSHSFMATSSNKKDLFVHPQTPTSIQKSYSVVRSSTNTLNSNLSQQQSPLTRKTTTSLSSSSAGIIKESILQLPTAKRLFMSPRQTKSITTVSLANNTSSNAAVVTAASTTDGDLNMARMPIQIQLQTQRPLTPHNKIPGLFSVYRECPDSSPLSSSSTSTQNYNWMK